MDLDELKLNNDCLTYFENHPMMTFEKKIGNQVYFKTHPDQKTGSLTVNLKTNLWYDFASDISGNIHVAIKEFPIPGLTTDKQSFSFERLNKVDRTISETEQKIKNIKFISNQNLLNFIEERGIDPAVAKQYLKEIHYEFYKNGEKKGFFYTLGMKNESYSWNTVNALKKIVIGGHNNYSHIKNKSSRLEVFEGVFDFLSRLMHKRASGMLLTASDYIILNGVKNDIPKEVLDKYNTIELYLDNDHAGNEKTAELISKSSVAVDKRFYPTGTDYNDFWKEEIQRLNKNHIEKKNSINRKI
ncbi:toprim domain-containing protein [Ornithobacterium rhinotracheale]